MSSCTVNFVFHCSTRHRFFPYCDVSMSTYTAHFAHCSILHCFSISCTLSASLHMIVHSSVAQRCIVNTFSTSRIHKYTLFSTSFIHAMKFVVIPAKQWEWCVRKKRTHVALPCGGAPAISSLFARALHCGRGQDHWWGLQHSATDFTTVRWMVGAGCMDVSIT